MPQAMETCANVIEIAALHDRQRLFADRADAGSDLAHLLADRRGSRAIPGRAAMTPHWEHFAHAADVGIRGFGATQGEAFEQAAMALVATTTDPASVAPREVAEIRCEAPDLELLLVDWLNALVYEMAVRRVLFGRFRVTLDGCRLTAQAWGERADAERHQPTVEVKGATYTELRVAPADGGWVAQTVVDV